jgi:geranylgeranyl diphosphate synthase, type I
VQQLTRVGEACATGGAGAAIRVLAGAMQELCRGQSADLAFEDRDRVSLAECVAMAEGKTGALLGGGL